MSDDLFPEEAIGTWLDGEGIGEGHPIAFERLAGGRSNVMFRVQRGDRRFVLRRPANVAIEKANAGMRREFLVLGALEGTPVPHPAPIALCDDDSVIGCTFYVMEEVDGVLPIAIPDSLGPAEVARREVTFAATDALALLHEVDWRAQGLGGFGRPDGFHDRQVSRWTAQFEGYGESDLSHVAETGLWLSEHRPTDWTPSIMHADYHMMNMLISPDPPARVAAILDWETATIGDPCSTSPDSAKSGAARSTVMGGRTEPRSSTDTPKSAVSRSFPTFVTTRSSTTFVWRSCWRASSAGRVPMRHETTTRWREIAPASTSSGPSRWSALTDAALRKLGCGFRKPPAGWTR